MNQNQIIHLQVHLRLALVTVKSLTSLRSGQSVLGQSEASSRYWSQLCGVLSMLTESALVLQSTNVEGVPGWCPEFRKKEDSPVNVWRELLVANWQRGRSSSQLVWQWLTRLARCPRPPFKRSVCQSVWGWFAVLIRSLTPRIANTSLKKADVKRGSRSETMDLLKPCNVKTLLT